MTHNFAPRVFIVGYISGLQCTFHPHDRDTLGIFRMVDVKCHNNDPGNKDQTKDNYDEPFQPCILVVGCGTYRRFRKYYHDVLP